MNMCPLVKRRIRSKLMEAQTLRFWRSGEIYGQAALIKLMAPRNMVVRVI